MERNTSHTHLECLQYMKDGISKLGGYPAVHYPVLRPPGMLLYMLHIVRAGVLQITSLWSHF